MQIPDNLPNDPEELKKLLLAAQKEIENQNIVLQSKDKELEIKTARINVSAKTPPASQKNKFMRYYVHEW